VFAHVERAWGSSIQWEGAVDDVETFNSTVAALLNGKPAGVATEYFNERYAEISTSLTEELDSTTAEMQDDVKLAGLWTSNNDSRNYTFIGDPAVRLPTGAKVTAAADRESLGTQVLTIPTAIASVSTGFQPDVEVRAGMVVKSSSGGPGENFGLSDIFKRDEQVVDENNRGASEGFKKFVDKLGDYLSKALDDATSLEISTYVAGEMKDVKYEAGKFSGAQLRAVTRISIDGDTLVCVPEKDGEVDTAVWDIHVEMVKAAQANRAELMKTVVSAATGIAGFGK